MWSRRRWRRQCRGQFGRLGQQTATVQNEFQHVAAGRTGTGVFGQPLSRRVHEGSFSTAVGPQRIQSGCKCIYIYVCNVHTHPELLLPRNWLFIFRTYTSSLEHHPPSRRPARYFDLEPHSRRLIRGRGVGFCSPSIFFPLFFFFLLSGVENIYKRFVYMVK